MSVIPFGAVKRSVLSGSYELLDLIAEGGMAEVFRARSRGAAGFEKIVVIKRVLPALMANPGFADLLVREAKIAARLSHSNVVQILDLGEEDGAYFIAMEYVHGQDLGRVIARAERRRGIASGAFPLAVRLWVIATVAKALDYAHRRRGDDGRPLHIVHRDISPQNILLSYDGQVKVADFGIARADEEGLGREEEQGVLRGKFAYMSPEQARLEPIDSRSDLFSLGLVLYEIITGDRAYSGRTPAEVLARARAGAMPLLEGRALSVPDPVVEVLRRALAIEPAQRYGSAAEMHAALMEILFASGVPVGESDLGATMRALFDSNDEASPNKLNVDLLMRAAEDARVVHPLTEASVPSVSHSGLHSVSITSRTEPVRAVVLLADEREDEGAVFRECVESFGGFVTDHDEQVREAVFGHVPPAELAGPLAARAALAFAKALRHEGPPRVEPVPAMSIVSGRALANDGGEADPDDATRARAVTLLRHARSGEVLIAEELKNELTREFLLDASSKGHARLEGFLPSEVRERVDHVAPLVGRNTVLERLSEAIVRASRADSEALLLVGEAGTGKSRIVRELARFSDPGVVHFVRGGGDRAAPNAHFGAIASMFSDAAGIQPEDTPRERFKKVDWMRVLGLSPRDVRIVGRLLGLEYPVSGDERPCRPLALELVVILGKTLRAIAGNGVTVALLSDVQWADDATRQLLPLLVKGLKRTRVVVLVTARPGTPCPPIDATLVGLERLDPTSAGRLYAIVLGARGVDPELRDRIVAETGGNPEWIELLALDRRAGAPQETVVVATPDGPFPIPPAMVDRIASRMAELRADDRDLLRVVAAFTRGVDRSLLAGVLGAPQADLDASLRRLCRARLIESFAGPEPLWPEQSAFGEVSEETREANLFFVRGDLVRRAIDASGDDATRWRVHRRIASVLEARGAAEDDRQIELLAYHAAASGGHPLAGEYLVLAGEVALDRRDHAAAARHFAQATRLLRASPKSNALSNEIALRAFESALEANELDTAAELLGVLDTRIVELDGVARVSLAVAHARLAFRTRRYADAVQRLEAVESDVASLEDGRLAGRARLELGRALVEVARPDEGASVLEEAINLLRRTPDMLLCGLALAMLAVAQSRRGPIEAARLACNEALVASTQPGAGELVSAALYAAAEVEEAAGNLVLAAERWEEVANAARSSETGSYATIRAALMRLEIGDEARAAVLAETAASHARSQRKHAHAGALVVSHLASAAQAALAASADRDSAYLTRAERAATALETSVHDPIHAAMALAMAARVRLRMGDTRGANQAFLHAAELAKRAGYDHASRRYSEAAAVLGDDGR